MQMNSKPNYILLLNAHTNYQKNVHNEKYNIYEYEISCQINNIISNKLNNNTLYNIKTLTIDASHIKPYNESLSYKSSAIIGYSNYCNLIAIETHLNAFNGNVKGWEILINNENNNSLKFANILKNNIRYLDGNKFRGIKHSTLHIPNRTKKLDCPVILFEPWFLDNDSEAKYCADYDYLIYLAEDVVNSIYEYFRN